MSSAAGRLRTVGLLARSAGIELLERSLLANMTIEPVGVATHRFLPRSESPDRAERAEFSMFQRLCADAGIPLFAVDDPVEARELPFLEAMTPIDLLCSVSWRFVLSPSALARPRVAAINLHRGKLPEFAGAEPVRRMIEAGLPDAVITAHEMVASVDAGPVLATVSLPIERDERLDSATQAECVKEALVPLYPLVFEKALRALEQAGR